MKQDKSKWISVEDDLPEFLTKVLCHDIRGNLIIGQLKSINASETSEGKKTSQEWFERSSYDEYFEIITHWQPLPDPPTHER